MDNIQKKIKEAQERGFNCVNSKEEDFSYIFYIFDSDDRVVARGLTFLSAWADLFHSSRYEKENAKDVVAETIQNLTAEEILSQLSASDAEILWAILLSDVKGICSARNQFTEAQMSRAEELYNFLLRRVMSSLEEN